MVYNNYEVHFISNGNRRLDYDLRSWRLWYTIAMKFTLNRRFCHEEVRGREEA